MCSSSWAGGAVPCERHTTMGVAQMVHSAIQQMSSSWNQGEIRAASQRSQDGSRSRSVMPPSVRAGPPSAAHRSDGARFGAPQQADSVRAMATSPSEGPSGTGYLVLPDSGSGPGVLVLHSWWGLNDFFRGVCDRLADAGFVALAPDLVGGGRTTDDPEVAERWLAESDTNVTADLVLSSAAILRNLAQTPAGPIGVCGWSMGASWALWLASRAPEQVGALSLLLRGAAGRPARRPGPLAGPLRRARRPRRRRRPGRGLEAALHLGDHPVDVHHYPGTNHWFFEAGPTHDPVAASLAWDRTVAFLHREHLDEAASRPTGNVRPVSSPRHTRRALALALALPARSRCPRAAGRAVAPPRPPPPGPPSTTRCRSR